jgi:hypothetical protein
MTNIKQKHFFLAPHIKPFMTKDRLAVLSITGADFNSSIVPGS